MPIKVIEYADSLLFDGPLQDALSTNQIWVSTNFLSLQLPCLQPDIVFEDANVDGNPHSNVSCRLKRKQS